jgi:hypothetical protein
MKLRIDGFIKKIGVHISLAPTTGAVALPMRIERTRIVLQFTGARCWRRRGRQHSHLRRGPRAAGFPQRARQACNLFNGVAGNVHASPTRLRRRQVMARASPPFEISTAIRQAHLCRRYTYVYARIILHRSARRNARRRACNVLFNHFRPALHSGVLAPKTGSMSQQRWKIYFGFGAERLRSNLIPPRFKPPAL